MNWNLPDDSFSKCLMYFKDGNTRTFYSLDWVHKQSKFRNRELGLARLRKLISTWGSNIKTAIIYDLSSGEEIERYNENIKQNHQI